LEIVLGIPIAVKDDHRVSGGEVDADTTSTSAQQENKAIRVGLTESIDRTLQKNKLHQKEP